MSEQTPKQERRSFGRLFDLLFPLVKAFYPMRCRGKENIPEGPAVVCANHSNYIDPLLVAAAFGKENYMHFMAKLELQRVPGRRRRAQKVRYLFCGQGQERHRRC